MSLALAVLHAESAAQRRRKVQASAARFELRVGLALACGEPGLPPRSLAAPAFRN